MLVVAGLALVLVSCGSSSGTPAKNGPKGASCKNQSSPAGQSGAQNSSGSGTGSSASGTGGTGATGGGNGSNGAGGSSTGGSASPNTGSDSGSLQGSGAPDCASKPDFKTNNDGGTGAGK